MQVVAKKPLIDVNIEGKGTDAIIDIIKVNIPNVKIVEDDAIDIDEWDYYAKMKSRLTPAKVLKIRRENAELSQAALSEKCGIAASNIAQMETGKRGIGAKSAKRLAEALDCDPMDFLS